MKQNGTNIKRFVIFLNALFQILLCTSAFAYVWEKYYNLQLGNFFFKNGNIVFCFLYAVIYFILIELYGGFRLGSLRITDSVFSHVIALIFTDLIAYLQICMMAKAFLNPAPLFLTLVPDAIALLIWNIYIHRNFARLFPPKKMILVYANKSARSLVYKMSKRYDKFIICAAINVDEGFERIASCITDYDAVVICDTPNEIRNDILKFCFKHRIVAYVTPKISDILIRGSEELHILDTPLLVSRNFGAKLEQRILKRMFDLTVSFLALVFLSPFLAAAAIAVKAQDGGPVIYKQRRLTYGGRTFELYKFRSMIVDAEKDGQARLAAEGDSRITPVGAFLRKTRLDELPQLLNILKGEMSIVGPRPERPEIAEEYEDSIPEFSFRLNAKAGLTGYAQVMGKYNTTPYDKLKLDLIYIENFSLLLDLKIIMMTIKTIFEKESTEGIDENALNAMDLSYREEAQSPAELKV
ncbi:MAG: sugar transferase [Bacteroides sp.]|nr:sugar transferase [Eubacterium sp.]MCM1417201.1 sugar transferase [Roseburia sp.]MCM1461178.1 sugar transferase [Bacteroides sp.]